MTIKAQLADGRVLEFPDGTPPEVMQGAVKRILGTPDPIVPGVEPPAAPEQPATAIQAETPTAEDVALESGSEAEIEANEILGVDPTVKTRGAFLPFVRDAQDQLSFGVPEVALEVARGVLLPGQALRGTEVTEEDVAKMALAVAPGGAAVRRVPKRTRITAKKIAEAPSAERLKSLSRRQFREFEQSSALLQEDDFVTFMAGAEQRLADEGADAVLHPKLTRIFTRLTDRLGTGDLDAAELGRTRRIIGIAARSLDPDEARLGKIFRDELDDFVESLPGTEVWRKARNTYGRFKRQEMIENAVVVGSRAKSGVQNGIRQELRRILNSEKKMRGFTKTEREAMENVVDGDFTTNSLIRLSKLGFGSGQQTNILGGSAGVAGGSLLGGAIGLGTVGAVAVPAAGFLAGRQAQRRTEQAAGVLRALIGGARPTPLRGRAARAGGQERAVGGALLAAQPPENAQQIIDALAASQAASKEEDITRGVIQRELTRVTDPGA